MAKVLKAGYYNLLQHFKGYNAQDSLVLWLQMSPSEPTDRTEIAGTTPAYVGSPTPTTQQFTLPPGNKIYRSVTYSSIANQDGYVTNSSGLFCFTSLADGGTPTATSDRPFSISLWVKLDDATTSNYFFTKRAQATPWYEYTALLTSSGEIRFVLGDSNAGNVYVRVTSANVGPSGTGQIQTATWTHLAFTYDGRGGSSPTAGMAVYINGQAMSTTASSLGTYVGMQPDYLDKLYLGTAYAGTQELDGQMAEFAAWSTELSVTEVKAVYDMTLLGDNSISGILNNPPRTILRALDCATGSYPTVSRMGDTTRLGRYATSFDDRNTIVFASGSDVTLSLPLGIQILSGSVGYAYMSQSVATPNTNSTLTATGIVRKGVADANIHLTPGEDFAPFKEDGLYVISKDARVDPFYMTGSRIQDVGPGFSQPLGAKTKIVFDLTANVSSAFGFYPSSGTPRPHLMSYFDHGLRKWVPTGEGFFNSFEPPEADVRSMLENNCLGFGPTQDSIVAEKGFLAAMGLPVSTYGFPSSARYHATSSCAWPLSGVLDRPFVAEKFVYEFSASYECRNHGFTDMFYWDANENAGNGGYVSIGSNDGPSISSFFILNQRGPFKGSVTLTSPYTTAADPNTITEQYSFTETLPTVTGGHYVDTTRDLVTYGQIHVYPQTVTWPTLDDVVPSDTATVRSFKEYFEGVGGYSPEGQRHGRELNVGTLPTYNNVNPMFEGRFIMSGTMKVCGRNEGGYPLRSNIGGSARLQRMNWESHGRNLFTMNTGRDLVRGAPGQGPAHPGYRVITDLTSTEAFGPPVKATQVVNSPYLLKPSDSLIFGWQVPPSWNYYNPDPGPTGKKEHWIELAPGPSRLTIYGSEVAENKEHHPGLNQHLTSDAVHELVGFHGPPLDQFETEFRSQYSGSFLAQDIGIQRRIVSGSAGDGHVLIYSSSLLRRRLGSSATMRWDAGQYHFTIAACDGIVSGTVADMRIRPSSQFRNIRCTSDANFYDCYVPAAVDMIRAVGLYPYTGNYLGQTTEPNGYQLLLNLHSGGTYGAGEFKGWWAVFPFEPRFLGLSRRVADPLPPWQGRIFQALGWDVRIGTSRFGDSSRKSIDVTWPWNLRTNGSGGTFLTGKPEGGGVTTTSRAAKRSLLTFIFGIGDAGYGWVQGRRIGDGKGGARTASGMAVDSNGPIRGFKYGIYNTVEQGPMNYFRGSQYGQLRDMLEQGLDSRILSRRNGRLARSAPVVTIRFVDSAGNRLKKQDRYQTASSNLSPYATSSLPYFDGIANNRPPIMDATQGTSVVSI